MMNSEKKEKYFQPDLSQVYITSIFHLNRQTPAYVDLKSQRRHARNFVD